MRKQISSKISRKIEMFKYIDTEQENRRVRLPPALSFMAFQCSVATQQKYWFHFNPTFLFTAVFFLVSLFCLFFTALPSSIEFDEFRHDGLRDHRVLSRHLPLLRHAHVLRLTLDTGPVHEERVVENHKIVVQDTKLITLKVSKRKLFLDGWNLA